MNDVKLTDNKITIKNKTGSFEILIGGNTDLYFRPIVEESLLTSPDEIEIIIDENDSFIYEYINQLYNNVMHCNPYNKNKVSRKDKEKEMFTDQTREYPLRNGNTIVWRSNESVIETSSILEISKEENNYRLKFIKGLVGGFMYTYAINFCNSGSIYHPYQIPFYTMYNDMLEALKNKVKIK